MSPTAICGFSETFRELTRALNELGHRITARQALEALLADDIGTARAALDQLPPSYLDRLAPAAAQLADLARHVASLDDRT